MYEEAVAVPFMLSGLGVEQGQVCSTAVTHVDAFQTILEATGVASHEADRWLPGTSLFAIADGAQPDRVAFSEYHGMGSSTGTFMLRHKQYKYVYSIKHPAQLFDLSKDPEELRDLGGDPTYQKVLEECHELLLKICDPHAVDAAAKERQAEQLAAYGGREAVIARGDLGFSPPPGIQADFA